MPIDLSDIDILGLFKCKLRDWDARSNGSGPEHFHVVEDWPEIYIRNNYIRGLLSTKGNDEGRYPDPYLDFVDRVFGREPDTMEICSRYVQADGWRTGITVDINPKFKPTYCTDAQTLAGLPAKLKVRRIRGDPPYNEKTAREMYGTDLPNNYQLIRASTRHLVKGGLIFLLTGPVNYQKNFDHLGIRHIGTIALTVVPNWELRACNIFYKFADVEEPTGQGQLA